jgi:hypothetical protein
LTAVAGVVAEETDFSWTGEQAQVVKIISANRIVFSCMFLEVAKIRKLSIMGHGFFSPGT